MGHRGHDPWRIQAARKRPERSRRWFLDTPLQKDFVVRNEWRFIGDRGLRANIACWPWTWNGKAACCLATSMATAVDHGHRRSSGPRFKPRWDMCSRSRRPVVGKPVDGCRRTDTSMGSGTGLRRRQNTFRANVLRSGFMGSPKTGVFCRGELPLRRLRRVWNVDCAGGACGLADLRHVARTEHVPGAFWRQRGRAIPVPRLCRGCASTSTTCGARW